MAPGLFPLKKTGVSTRQITDAARAFVDSLSEPQRERALFPLESDAWRRWSNIHPFLMRHGVSLDEMSAAQRERALALLRESLSTPGFRDGPRRHAAQRARPGDHRQPGREYGEWLYWLSIMGLPSFDGPWGWQIDGHHLIVNCFVLGDQVVMTPMFMGSEPVAAHEGPYAGTRVFQAEEQPGPGAHAGAHARAAPAGDHRHRASRRGLHRGVPRQLRAEVPGHPPRAT